MEDTTDTEDTEVFEKKIYHDPTRGTIALVMICSFALSVLILALALLKVQVCPGGKFTLLVYDMHAQFSPVISSFRYIGQSDNSLLYSFYGALGNNAFLNYASYIADPTVWLTALFPLEQLPNAIYFITLFKTGLCGVGACAYFFFGTRGRKYPFVILILSVCYALMSYNILYSQCILWYNVVALAPVILVGLGRIIDGEKGGIYIICMTLALYYNYQLAYMTGIFAVMFLIYRLSENTGNWKGITGRFIACNLLSVGMFMPVFIPVLYNVMNGRMKSYKPMGTSYLYYPVWNLAKQFLSCQYTSIETGGLPNIFCGTFIPLIAILAFILPLSLKRSRMILAGIFVFFIASFCVVPLNRLWHGFNEPNSFPARYSFLLCLYMLMLAYCVICFALEKKDITGRVAAYRTVCTAALIVTCMEMYLNAGYILTSLNLEMGYVINADYQLKVREMKEVMDKIDDDDFYRIGRDLPFSLNDGMLFGYNGIGYFSSMFERTPMEFIGMLGYTQNEHTIRDPGGTPLTESLLGVKYKIVSSPDLFGYYESMYNSGLYDLQYNENSLPLGFLTKYKKYDPDDDAELAKGIQEHNSFAFQEYVLSELQGERVKVFENIDYSREDIENEDFARYVRMKFTATCDKPVWIYCSDECDGRRVTAPDQVPPRDTSDASTGEDEARPGSALLKVNGEEIYPFVDKMSTMCIYLGTFREGQEVEVEAACVNKFDDPWIVYYDSDECGRVLDDIRKTGIEITEHKNGVIKGRINVVEGKDLLIMTMPYMEGYRVKVDGIRTDYGAYRDALFALMLEPGEHTVEISFIPHGFIPGAIIGLIFISLAGIYLIVNKIPTRYTVSLQENA